MHKRFCSSHNKSIALAISLAAHAVLVVVAFSLISITVVQKRDAGFKAKPFSRSGMPLRKLQVPMKVVKRPIRKPRLRKWVVVDSGFNQNMPDIAMPEIRGVKGGLGRAGEEGLGYVGGLGFSMPEIEVFGVKGKGEKLFFILDASPEMMHDEMGGISAYSVIKRELVGILGDLPPTTLFNLAVFDASETYLLFPSMVPATIHNVGLVNQWLKPLNAVRTDMGDDEFGGKTLGPGGAVRTDVLLAGNFKEQERWYLPTMLAMKQQADAVFLLTNWWGNQRYRLSSTDRDWYASSAGRRWNEHYEKALKLLDRDNRERRVRGEPPRALRRDDRWGVVTTYFPELERPPDPGWHCHTARDFAETMLGIREAYESAAPLAGSGSATRDGNESAFSFNVVHFREEVDVWHHPVTEENFKKLVSIFKGGYRTVAGLEAIENSVGKRSGK